MGDEARGGSDVQCEDGTSSARTGLKPDFNIYDCASGKILWRMPPRRFAPDNAPDEQLNFQSSWSPDGTRLLLLDRFTRGVFVLGPGAIGG